MNGRSPLTPARIQLLIYHECGSSVREGCWYFLPHAPTGPRSIRGLTNFEYVGSGPGPSHGESHACSGVRGGRGRATRRTSVRERSARSAPDLPVPADMASREGELRAAFPSPLELRPRRRLHAGRESPARRSTRAGPALLWASARPSPRAV